MHFLIFGKFMQLPQSSNLPTVYLWDRKAMIHSFAAKYKYHKMPSNLYKYDVRFNEEVLMYRLDDQYDEQNSNNNNNNNKDIIMIDPKEIRNYNYYEKKIINKSLSQLYSELEKEYTNIIIHLFNM